jgi:hypothetical protein
LDLQTSACIIPRIRLTCRRPVPRAGGRFAHLLAPVMATAIALAYASAAVAQDDPKVKAGLEVWKSSGCLLRVSRPLRGWQQRERRCADRSQSAPDAARQSDHRGNGQMRPAGRRHAELRRRRLHDARLLRTAGGAEAGRSLSGAPRPECRGNRRGRRLPARAHHRAGRGDAAGMRGILRRTCELILRRRAEIGRTPVEVIRSPEGAISRAVSS